MNYAQHVLPADVFDALELSALVHGGIGSACLYDDGGIDAATSRPVCIIGHAMFLDGYMGLREDAIRGGESPVTDALVAAFPDLAPPVEGYRGIISAIESVNDHEVGEYDDERRVSWKQWCRLLNVVRGDN